MLKTSFSTTFQVLENAMTNFHNFSKLSKTRKSPVERSKHTVGIERRFPFFSCLILYVQPFNFDLKPTNFVYVCMEICTVNQKW